MKTRRLLVASAIGLTASANAFAANVYEDEEQGISVGVGALVQPWFQITGPVKAGQGSGGIGAPSSLAEGDANNRGEADNPSFDFFLRRIRLMVYGSLGKSLTAYVATDQPDLGKGGSFAARMSILDAFFTYQLVPEFMIDAGLMTVPFARKPLEAASALNVLDVPLELLRVPTSQSLRDTGLQFRGNVLRALHYRLGAFEGARNYAAEETPVEPVGASYPQINKNGMPRFAGQLRLNLMGTEDDFSLEGIYFSPTPIISIGVGGDMQPDAVLKLNAQPGMYTAVSGDVFVEYPFGAEDEILFEAGVIKYGEGWARVEGSAALETGGVAAYAEAGFRHRWFEPVVELEVLQAKQSDVTPITSRDRAILAIHAGPNFWIDQHRFNVKLDFGYRETKKDARLNMTSAQQQSFVHKDLLATLQGQVFF